MLKVSGHLAAFTASECRRAADDCGGEAGTSGEAALSGSSGFAAGSDKAGTKFADFNACQIFMFAVCCSGFGLKMLAKAPAASASVSKFLNAVRAGCFLSLRAAAATSGGKQPPAAAA